MISRRLKPLVVKELLSYLRDPRARLILVGPPLMQLLVFSFAVTLDVRNIDVAILDFDRGPVSAEVVAALEAAGFVDELVFADNDEQLRDLIDRREVLVGVRFGPEFSAAGLRGNRPRLQLLADGRRANAAQIVAGYVSRIVADLRPDRAADPPGDPIAVRYWFNPNLNYQWFVVPSLSGVLAMLISLVVPALSIARERELGTFDQLLVTPVTAGEIIVGKMMPALIVGTVIAGLMIAAAVFGFRVPLTGSPTVLALSLVVFIASVVGIGLAISAVCQTQQQAILGAFMVAVPIVLLSGFATPVQNMPGWLQVVAEANPLKHYLVIVQGTFLKALPVPAVMATALPMAAIAVVTLTAATMFVRGKLQ